MKKHFMFKVLLTLLVGMFLSVDAFAQQITVKGLVKDGTGEPVIGANVLVKGTTNGTITDFDGNFQLTANQGDIIVVSFIGYSTQELPAAANMNIVLKDDTELMQEVVVIGYGTARKNDLTGSVTAMKPDEMNKGLITSAQDMMQGKIAGVSVINGGGEPGGGATIRIRGGSSLNASNDPLIVIDGLAMDSYGVQGMSNPLALVNPADIESFTVLKDASATAIYGSRASNGVILITTKKGRRDSKPSISYNGNVSVSTVADKLDVLNAGEYMDFVQNTFGYTDEEFLASPEYANLGYYDANGNHVFADTDWQNEIYRTAISTDHNITIAGGLKNMPYRVSLGYTNQQGTLKTSSFERYTASVNVSPSFLDDHLKVNLNAKGMYSKTSYANTGAIGNATSMDPTKPVYGDTELYKKNYAGYWQWASDTDWNDSEWKYGVNTLAPTNPVSLLYLSSDKGDAKKLMGNIELDYKVHGFEDLRLHMNGGMDLGTGESNKWNSPYYYSSGTYYYGNKGWNTQDTYNLSLNMYAQYTKEFNENHYLDVMGGYEWQHFHIEKDYFYSGFVPTTNNTIDPEKGALAGQPWNPSDPNKTLYKSENYLVSFFGRLNYTLMNKYLFTVTLRNDGSSRFAKDNRWGLFPSAAFAWKVKEESFLKNVDVLDDFKVRLGFGITGQQEGSMIGDYSYFAIYTPNDNGAYYPILGDGTTYRPEAYNKDLTWEKTTTYNAGIDLAFFNNRLTANVDYYYRKTEDLLNKVYVSAGTNFAAQVISNIGSLHNQGVEVAMTWRPVQTKDWYWELGYNFTYNQNQIDELLAAQGDDYTIQYGGAAVGVGSNGIKAWRKGESASAFYTYQQVYDEKGLPIQGEYVDRDGNGIINDEDRYFYKKADADVLMGLTSKVTYKNWDLGMSFRASLNNYVYNAVEAGKSNISASNIYSGESWHNVADIAIEKKWQTVTSIDALSDYFIQNASFLKCDNITLGYSFDKLFGRNISGRAYLTAQNVFTITDYKGIDPEINGGYDGNIYPRPFVGIFGLSLNF